MDALRADEAYVARVQALASARPGTVRYIDQVLTDVIEFQRPVFVSVGQVKAEMARHWLRDEGASLRGLWPRLRWVWSIARALLRRP